MSRKKLKFKENDLVTFIGNVCYKGSFGKKTIECKPGTAIVVKVSSTSTHSYLLHAPEGSDSDVDGWVNYKDVVEYIPEDEMEKQELSKELEDQSWEDIEVVEMKDIPEEKIEEIKDAFSSLNPILLTTLNFDYNPELNEPLTCMLKQSVNYLQAKDMVPCGILINSTGINEPFLSHFVQPKKEDDYYDDLIRILGKNEYGNDYNRNQRIDGAHAWIGRSGGGRVITVQTLPWHYKAGACGEGHLGNLNSGWIQINLCEDDLNDVFYFQDVYDELCKLCAYLCQTYNINPYGTVEVQNFSKGINVEVPTILCHKDAADLGLASIRADVYHWFDKFNISMETLRYRVYSLTKPKPSNLSGVNAIPVETKIELTEEDIEEEIENKEEE